MKESTNHSSALTKTNKKKMEINIINKSQHALPSYETIAGNGFKS
jgi:hypothetical protein